MPIDAPPFKVRQLICLVRQRLDDLPGNVVDEEDEAWADDDDGLRWSNKELCDYADEAQMEWARRRLIKDSTTAAVCQIAVTAGAATYAYHASIMKIDRVKYVVTATGDEYVLRKSPTAMLDHGTHNWQTHAAGVPDYYIEDADERSLSLYKKPAANGTLYLAVQRLPIARLTWERSTAQQLEIPAEHHRDLIHFIMGMAYSKPDAETEDMQRAEKAFARFEAIAGPRPSARLEKTRRDERRTYRRVRGQFL